MRSALPSANTFSPTLPAAFPGMRAAVELQHGIAVATKPMTFRPVRGRDASLWHILRIGIPDAVLGTVATVPTLDGEGQIHVPPATQSGAVLTVEGQGMSCYHGRGCGSLNVAVIVDIPQQLSPRQRRLFEQLREEEGQPVSNNVCPLPPKLRC